MGQLFRLEGVVCTGLSRQILSWQEVKVDQKVSVAVFTSRDEKGVGEGREDDTTWEGERARMFCLKVTGRGIGCTQVVICRLNVIKKLSEMSRDFPKMLSVIQLHVLIKSSWLPVLLVLVVVSHLRSNEARSGSGRLQCKASPDGFRSHQRLQVDCHPQRTRTATHTASVMKSRERIQLRIYNSLFREQSPW